MSNLNLPEIITRICVDLKNKFSKVSITRNLTYGTQSATVVVDGESYALYAPTPPMASDTTPKMDGTASAGSSGSFARGNHVHPTDTSRQETLVSGTNIKTVSGNSLLGSGDLAFTDLTQSLDESGQIQTWNDIGIQDLFGSYESGDTAANVHTVGNTFVWKTQLVQCTTAIAVGDTIAIGTNVSATSINKTINEIHEDVETLIDHDILPIPNEIPENEDLNNYWNPGVWFIDNGSSAATIDNVPQTTTGGKVITIAASTGTYSVQLYLTTDGKIYFRYKRGTSATPSSWMLITMQGTITAASLSAVSYASQSLTSAQQNQTLSNLGLTSDLKAAASVSVANFFSTNPLSSATYDIRKSGKVVSFYAYFASAPSSGTIKSGYRPCGGTSGHYMILPLLSKSSPYTPVGSVWINGNGSVTFYGASNGGYVSGTWVCT